MKALSDVGRPVDSAAAPLHCSPHLSRRQTRSSAACTTRRPAHGWSGARRGRMAEHGNPCAIIATGPNEVTFTFAADRLLGSVAVAGTFNSWRGDASPLRQGDAGRWQTTLPVSPGRHLYKYVLDSAEWVPDPANPWVSEDGQGNSCFTLTEAGELYLRRGEIGPAQPGPRAGASRLRRLRLRPAGAAPLPDRRDAPVGDALRPRRAALRRLEHLGLPAALNRAGRAQHPPGISPRICATVSPMVRSELSSQWPNRGVSVRRTRSKASTAARSG
jgi:hypothetical protein